MAQQLSDVSVDSCGHNEVEFCSRWVAFLVLIGLISVIFLEWMLK
jgi:hypothetical protein